jgi:hypothetical protein
MTYNKYDVKRNSKTILCRYEERKAQGCFATFAKWTLFISQLVDERFFLPKTTLLLIGAREQSPRVI